MLGSDAENAAARAVEATAEAERAAAERSGAEREAASWAAEAHRLRRLLQTKQLSARRRPQGGEDEPELTADGSPDIGELQAQIDQALSAREAAAQRASEHAAAERKAAQRAAVARASVTRLSAARSQVVRTQAPRPPSPPAPAAAPAAEPRLQPAAPPAAAAAQESHAPLAPPAPAVAETTLQPEASAQRQPEAAAPRRSARPQVELASEAESDAQPTEAAAAESALDLEEFGDEPVQPLGEELRAGLIGAGSLIEQSDALFEAGGSSGPVALSTPTYAEPISSWEQQASVAAAELAAQEMARAEATLARERAQRLESTALSARILLESGERSPKARWLIAASATLVLCVAGGTGAWWAGALPLAASTLSSTAQPSAAVAKVTRARPTEAIRPPGAPTPPRERKPAWLRHAVPPPDAEGRPLIAVIVDDMGMDEVISSEVVSLPGPLTIAFLPAAPRLARQAETARAAGHEVMAHVPMEPTGMGSNDPGPNYLGVRYSREELRARLAWNLNQLPGIVGINNHMGSLFTRSAEGMKLVMEELRDREMVFVDSVTTGSSVAAMVASEQGIPFTVRDTFLDDSRDSGHIMDRILELEAIARRKGSAVAICHPLPGTVAALATWLPHAKERGVQLVPITTVIQHQMAQRLPASS